MGNKAKPVFEKIWGNKEEVTEKKNFLQHLLREKTGETIS